jgi:hypothetical protein
MFVALYLFASILTAQAQKELRSMMEPAMVPSLTLPISEMPQEPGDMCRMFEAMVPRADLRYKKKSMNVLNTKIEYTFSDFQHYINAIMDALNLGDNIVLLVHDWGSVLGMGWVRRNEKRVKGVAMMGALVAPFYPILDTKEAVKRKGKAGAVHHFTKLYSEPGSVVKSECEEVLMA